MIVYDEEYIRSLFPVIPKKSENPNVIQHVSSWVEGDLIGVSNWVMVILEEEDTAWDPRDPKGELEGPLRVIYAQYPNGKLSLHSVNTYP